MFIEIPLEPPDDHRVPEQEQTPLQFLIKRDRIRDELNLQPVENFDLLHVTEDSQLQEFLLRKGYELDTGYVYYEFQHEVEHVSEDKELVFMKVRYMHTTL